MNLTNKPLTNDKNYISPFFLSIPVLVIELYLISTLILFSFGPVEWELENETKFWFLIAMYHCAFILGYFLAIKKTKITTSTSSPPLVENFIIKNYWFFSIIILIASLISYKNTTHNESYFPSNYFSDFFLGLSQPGIMRQKFIDTLLTAKGNKLITGFLALIVFMKYSLTPIMVITWERLNIAKKLTSIFLFSIPLFATISIGTNKLVLDTFFILASSIVVFMMSKKKGHKLEALKNRKTLVILAFSLLIFFPYYFNKTLNSRGVNNFGYMESVSKPGNIKIKKSETSIMPEFVHNFLIKVSVYSTQGYYGMSLALDEKFESTYGIGHSNFLLDQVNHFFKVNLIKRTFQSKISHVWDRLVQWHSFYSQAANDVSFYGVILIMFIVGYLLAKVYISIIFQSNIFAISIMPLFGIHFIFLPMNNQVFNFMESLFSFIPLLFFWLISQRKRTLT